GFKFQLMVYRLSYSTALDPNTCKPSNLARQELLVNINDPDLLNPNILNPNILNPNILNPNILNPAIENATFYANPGETINVKLRVFNLDKTANTITYTDKNGVTQT